MLIAFFNGQHARLAKGAFTALQWFCYKEKVDLSWSDKRGIGDADMILFYTERPDIDIWESYYTLRKYNVPVFYLLGNFIETEDVMRKRTVLENRIGVEQIATIHYNMLCCEASYNGKIRQFMEAAKEGNCYVNNVFYLDVSRAVFALQKYKEIYNG